MKYEDLRLGDIITPILPQLRAGKMSIKGDKIVYRHTLTPDTLWLPSYACPQRDCRRWLDVYFQFYGIIPKGCFNCWKIVVRFDKIADLFKIYDLQQGLGVPGKCGVETRSFIGTEQRYAAFWYGPLGDHDGSLELRRKIATEVRQILPLNALIHLKRGCSEMELKYGPSEAWQYNKQWDFRQALLDAVFESEESDRLQPSFVRNYVQSRWIEVAWERGDKSVWGVADPRSFPSAPTFYEDKKINPVDVPQIEIEEEEKNGRITLLQ